MCQEIYLPVLQAVVHVHGGEKKFSRIIVLCNSLSLMLDGSLWAVDKRTCTCKAINVLSLAPLQRENLLLLNLQSIVQTTVQNVSKEQNK